jgi:hypothetical protein
MALVFSSSVAVAATSASHPKKAESSLTGAWSGKYGGAYHGTFTLHWKQKGSRLSGRIQLSATRAPVSVRGTVHGSTIRFGTVGTSAITYSGTVSGKSMSGSYQTPGGGGSWSAHKTS